MSTDAQAAPWLTTTPEAVLRAESILVAFSEGRYADIGTTLAADYTTEGATPLHTMVALLCMADRLADGYAHAHEVEHRGVIREAARVVAEAVYRRADDA